MKSSYLIGLLAVAPCAPSSSSSPGAGPSPGTSPSATPPNPDPRVGLKAGWMNAAQATWNLRLVSSTPPCGDFVNPSTPGPKLVWPPSFALARAYLDRLGRSNGLVADRVSAARTALAGAQR